MRNHSKIWGNSQICEIKLENTQPQKRNHWKYDLALIWQQFHGLRAIRSGWESDIQKGCQLRYHQKNHHHEKETRNRLVILKKIRSNSQLLCFQMFKAESCQKVPLPLHWTREILFHGFPVFFSSGRTCLNEQGSKAPFGWNQTSFFSEVKSTWFWNTFSPPYTEAEMQINLGIYMKTSWQNQDPRQ